MKKINLLFVQLLAFKAVFKLARICDGSILYRCKVINKYYPIYVYHTGIQNKQFAEKLNKLNQQRMNNEYRHKLKTFVNLYSQKINKKLQWNSQSRQKVQQIMKDSSLAKKQVKTIIYKSMEYLSLYYESLQHLIQGRREVLNNEEYKFQDGQSVVIKRKKFQKWFSKIVGKKQSSLDIMQEVQFMKETQRQDKKQ